KHRPGNRQDQRAAYRMTAPWNLRHVKPVIVPSLQPAPSMLNLHDFCNRALLKFRPTEPCSAFRPRLERSFSRSSELAGVSSRPAHSRRSRDGVLTREPVIGNACALLCIIMCMLSPRVCCWVISEGHSVAAEWPSLIFSIFHTVNHMTVILGKTR